ncbi:riboflavin synthase [Micrococcoides hystricis]|uniref:Riboflavin synthase n=1 Tax=Micrococcoides hystricis TaxID=1572761 RepID=A0ABV6P7X2_9MICC
MFTGIVTGTGTVTDLAPLIRDGATVSADQGRTITLHAPGHVDAMDLGASLAVNGVCLTATEIDEQAETLSLEVMGETLRLTNIGQLDNGSTVNLERCVRAADRLDGHVVQGHVDGLATLVEREDLQGWERFRFELPTSLAKYVATKGSIAVNGVSLTVTAVSEPDAATHFFEVGLIPTTLNETTLGQLRVGDAVNIEVDVLAKYAERLAAFLSPAVPPHTETTQ